MPPDTKTKGRRDGTAPKDRKAEGMESFGLIVALVLGTGFVWVMIFPLPPRAPRLRSQEDIRREWAQARPHWRGYDDWKGGKE